MTKQLLATVKWLDIYSGNTALYASDIVFKKDCVEYYNPRVSSGKIIVRFVSRTNYQGNRCSPSLPVLTPSKTYTLIGHYDVQPEGRFYMQLDFSNRQGEIIESKIVRSKEETFICPEETFTYSITLCSAGCNRLVFYDLQLFDGNGEAYQAYDIMAGPSPRKYQRQQIPEELEFVTSLIQFDE